MIISLAFTVWACYLGLKLYRHERGHRLLNLQAEYQTVYILAILVGLWSAFVFGAPGASELYGYVEQGKVDSLQSEIPDENPPILPPVSRREFAIKVAPSVFGVIGSLFYVSLAIVASYRRKIFALLTYVVVGWDLSARLWHLVAYPYLRPLPTFEQNVMFGLLWFLPFAICTLFSFYWIQWTHKYQRRGVAQLG